MTDPVLAADARARHIVRAQPDREGDDPVPEGEFGALFWAARAARVVCITPALWPLVHEELAVVLSAALRVVSEQVRRLAEEVKGLEPTDTSAYAVEARKRLRVSLQELQGMTSALKTLTNKERVAAMVAKETDQ